MSGRHLRLVRPGEKPPHVCLVNALVASFLRLGPEQQAAALSEALELADEQTVFAAGALTDKRTVMVLVAGHTKEG